MFIIYIPSICLSLTTRQNSIFVIRNPFYLVFTHYVNVPVSFHDVSYKSRFFGKRLLPLTSSNFWFLAIQFTFISSISGTTRRKTTKNITLSSGI